MTKEYIDLKELDNLVPKEFRWKINLLFNKDVPKEPKTADDLILHRLAQLKETDIQQHFNKETQALASELMFLDKKNRLHFVQNDNGDTAGGKLNEFQRMALYKRKKAEGSKSGFPDVTIFSYVAKARFNDTTYCEVKTIGSPSQVRINVDQLKWFLELNEMGFDSYITNNPKFFREEVLGEIKKYFI